jgi:hypothetical protein
MLKSFFSDNVFDVDDAPLSTLTLELIVGLMVLVNKKNEDRAIAPYNILEFYTTYTSMMFHLG